MSGAGVLHRHCGAPAVPPDSTSATFKKLETKWLERGDGLKSAAKIRRMVALKNMLDNAELADMLARMLDFDRTQRLRAHDLMYGGTR
eukprot:gene10607-11626_t